MNSCQLSIIVPTLNDTDEVQGLLVCLANQRGVSFEVLICDCGSHDSLPELLAEWNQRRKFPVRMIATERGRGAQMNAGAASANGELLLFLHADSRFDIPDALLQGVNAYTVYRNDLPCPCAARFRLEFRRKSATPSLGYFYHEAKARLNRGDCIRGDQGYLIQKSSFEQLGHFDSSLPFLEDVRLASLLAAQGKWLLLPATISTSARRFEQEGYYERQVANVIIVNAVETGWDELLCALPGLYSCTANGHLQLYPLLKGVRRLIDNHDQVWRTSFWKATGRHVAANAWQLFFWLDVRRAFSANRGPDEVAPYWLGRYEHHLKPYFSSQLAACAAQYLTRIWLWWMLHTSRKISPIKTNQTDAQLAP
jgi:rSAM/selenodomain-associated transferase 2